MKLFTTFIKNLPLTILLTIGMCIAANAQTIKGKVTDAGTKEPMVGATVLLKGTDKSQVVQLDGYFTFRNLKPGDYELELHFVSYKTIKSYGIQ